MSQPYGTFQQLQLDKLTAIEAANSSHSTNATKLTNIQTITDTKLSAIQNFLDKDNSQFHLKHHTTSNLIGNTSADGSGSHNHLHVDGNGVAKSSVVNTVNINPANEVNGLGSPSKSFNVSVANQPNFKLEDLSSSLNAQNASGTSRSVAVGLKGTTNISDVPSGSTFLKCDSAGKLETKQPLENDTINASLSVPTGFGGGATSAEIEIKSKPYKGKVAIVIENPSVAGASTTVSATFATSSGGTFYNVDLSHIEQTATGNCNILIIKDFVPPFIKVNIQQSSGGAVNYSVKAIY